MKIYAVVEQVEDDYITCRTQNLNENFKFDVDKKYIKFHSFRGCEISIEISHEKLIIKKCIPKSNKDCMILDEMKSLIEGL